MDGFTKYYLREVRLKNRDLKNLAKKLEEDLADENLTDAAVNRIVNAYEEEVAIINARHEERKAARLRIIAADCKW